MRKFCLILTLLFACALRPFAGTETTDSGAGGAGVPRYTLDQAVLTALQRNADIQRAKQEIERTKGLYLELRADIFPRIDELAQIQNTDPHLGRVSSSSGSGGLSAVPTQYSFTLQATQIVFAGGRVISNIR